MVHVRPLRGLRYRLSTRDGAASLLAPPYDVIDDEGRAQLAARSPDNCVHVILPQGTGEAKYSAGAQAFARLANQALVRDETPGIYVYHQRFVVEGQTYVRKGLICLIELTPFGEGPVKPHERTLAGPKADRLALMRACDAHLELVFGLFPDPQRQWEAALGDHLGAPVLACEFDGTFHQLYRVEDPGAIESLQQVLATRNVYIADGHHRYETMCAFRRELEAQGRAEVGKWGLIYLSNLDDPGLVVLPTHRLVHDVPTGVNLPALAASLEPWFEVEKSSLPADPVMMRQALAQAASTRPAFALAVPGSGQWLVCRLRGDFNPAQAGLGHLPPALARLDLALLHELVLERGLGIDKQRQAAKSNLDYTRDNELAWQTAAHGDGRTQLVCLMHPIGVHDVVAVCDSGEVMPQKSTYFYPKIPTGLVFHSLRPDTQSAGH